MRQSYGDQDEELFGTLELGSPATDSNEYTDEQLKLASDIKNVIAQYFSDNVAES